MDDDIPRGMMQEISRLSTALAAAERERDAWIETARQHHANEEFYHGLVTKIGKTFGPPAYTSDDGSVQQDVLALKVPELVASLSARIVELEGASTKLIEGARNITVQHGAYPEDPLWKVQDADLKALIAALSSPHPNTTALLDAPSTAHSSSL